MTRPFVKALTIAQLSDAIDLDGSEYIAVSIGGKTYKTTATQLLNSTPLGISIISKTMGINAKSVNNSLLYTNSTGKTVILTNAIIRCTAASGISNGPSAGLGTIAGTDNIFASTAMNTLTTTTSIFGFSSVGISMSVPDGGQVFFNLGTPSTGTSQTLAVDLIGYSV
jgi:hypothetical protein